MELGWEYALKPAGQLLYKAGVIAKDGIASVMELGWEYALKPAGQLLYKAGVVAKDVTVAVMESGWEYALKPAGQLLYKAGVAAKDVTVAVMESGWEYGIKPAGQFLYEAGVNAPYIILGVVASPVLLPKYIFDQYISTNEVQDIANDDVIKNNLEVVGTEGSILHSEAEEIQFEVFSVAEAMQCGVSEVYCGVESY